VTFSRLTSTARAVGAGADNAKDGHATVSVADMVILGNPVELTGAGLKLSHGAVSEQEAYDGAKALLAELRQEHGIGLEFGDQADDILREASQVTVRVEALTVRFDSVQTPQSVGKSIEQVVSLGSSTMLIMAFDRERQIDVSYEGDDVVVQAQPEGQAPAASPATAPPPTPSTAGAPTPSTAGQAKSGPAGPNVPKLQPNGDVRVRVKPNPAPAPAPAPTAPPVTPGVELEGEAVPAPATESPAPSTGGVDENAFGIKDISEGLKDARAVSRAFGAFLALGLVLPLARFIIKRFG
jgi:hypothetical protein